MGLALRACAEWIGMRAKQSVARRRVSVCRVIRMRDLLFSIDAPGPWGRQSVRAGEDAILPFIVVTKFRQPFQNLFRMLPGKVLFTFDGPDRVQMNRNGSR